MYSQVHSSLGDHLKGQSSALGFCPCGRLKNLRGVDKWSSISKIIGCTGAVRMGQMMLQFCACGRLKNLRGVDKWSSISKIIGCTGAVRMGQMMLQFLWQLRYCAVHTHYQNKTIQQYFVSC